MSVLISFTFTHPYLTQVSERGCGMQLVPPHGSAPSWLQLGTKSGAGAGLAILWASHITISNLQMCIPQFIPLGQKQICRRRLVEDTPTPSKRSSSPSSPAVHLGPQDRSLKNVTGEFSPSSILFSYPSRPSVTVLADVFLYPHPRTDPSVPLVLQVEHRTPAPGDVTATASVRSTITRLSST